MPSEEVGEVTERNMRRVERDMDDLRRVAATPEGRRFLWRLLGRAGIFRLSFVGDAAGTAFREGERNMGLWVLNDLLSLCPERFRQMMDEAERDEGVSC